jgi:hypothetical protein
MLRPEMGGSPILAVTDRSRDRAVMRESYTYIGSADTIPFE